jgi:hypothetical protein
MNVFICSRIINNSILLLFIEFDLDIKSAIQKNLPDLEQNCYDLADRCREKFPDWGKEIELCNQERIKEVFQETGNELEKIWEEKMKNESETEKE